MLVFAGAFTLAEIDLARSVPPEALAPFAKELAARQRRHERQAAQQAERSRQEAAYEASLASASAAPSAAQLRVRILSNSQSGLSGKYCQFTPLIWLVCKLCARILLPPDLVLNRPLAILHCPAAQWLVFVMIWAALQRTCLVACVAHVAPAGMLTGKMAAGNASAWRTSGQEP